jgi:hypothetical protein
MAEKLPKAIQQKAKDLFSGKKQKPGMHSQGWLFPFVLQVIVQGLAMWTGFRGR